MLENLSKSKFNLSRFSLLNCLIIFIYILPFSFLQISFLPFSSIPYTYFLTLILLVFYFLNFGFINLRFDSKFFFLFCFAIIWMTISCIINDNFSYMSIIGISLRLFCILLATLFTIDIDKIFKHLLNSVPLYILTTLLIGKIGLVESIEVNSNILSATYVSIVLLLFTLKSRFNFYIPQKNRLLLVFTSILLIIFTESRSSIISLILSAFFIYGYKFFKRLFTEKLISKTFLKIIIVISISFGIYLLSIIGLNRSNEYTLSRYYLLTDRNSSQSDLKALSSDAKRYFLLKYSLEGLKEKPLFGFGSGNNQELFKIIREFNFMNQRRSLHNSYLTISYQYGIPSLFLLILFCRRALLLNYYKFNDISLNFLISYTFVNSFFSDTFAKNYFILILFILSIGYKLKNSEYEKLRN